MTLNPFVYRTEAARPICRSWSSNPRSQHDNIGFAVSSYKSHVHCHQIHPTTNHQSTNKHFFASTSFSLHLAQIKSYSLLPILSYHIRTMTLPPHRSDTDANDRDEDKDQSQQPSDTGPEYCPDQDQELDLFVQSFRDGMFECHSSTMSGVWICLRLMLILILDFAFLT